MPLPPNEPVGWGRRVCTCLLVGMTVVAPVRGMAAPVPGIAAPMRGIFAPVPRISPPVPGSAAPVLTIAAPMRSSESHAGSWVHLRAENRRWPLMAPGDRLQARPSPSLKLPRLASGNDRAEQQQGSIIPRSRRFYLGLAVSAGAALSAWWSEQRANDAYDRYMRSAGLARQQRAFARAERYDRLTGASLLGMQLGLIYSTYVYFY